MITATGIVSSYGRRRILKGASFTAARGECVGIVGANGCGKSTLLSILAGTLKPKSGMVVYGGQVAWGCTRKRMKGMTDLVNKRGAADAARRGAGGMRCDREVIRRMTGYVPQENPLIPELTVYDNLRLWYPDKRSLKQELETGFLSLMGIGAFCDKRADALSGGMKKRVSIGIAMAGRPPILLLDEPGAALDLVCKEDIRSYLQTYLAHGGTVVITTHEESELSLCGRIYVMKNGVLEQADNRLRGRELARLF